jgi:hypothetical protein
MDANSPHEIRKNEQKTQEKTLDKEGCFYYLYLD